MKFKNILTLSSGLAVSVMAFQLLAIELPTEFKRNAQAQTNVSLPVFKASDFKHDSQLISDGYKKVSDMKAVPEFLAAPDEVITMQGDYALVKSARSPEINEEGLFAGDVLKNHISGGFAVVTGHFAVRVDNQSNLNALLEQFNLAVVKNLNMDVVIVKPVSQVDLNQLQGKMVASGLVKAVKLEKLENLNQAF